MYPFRCLDTIILRRYRSAALTEFHRLRIVRPCDPVCPNVVVVVSRVREMRQNFPPVLDAA